MIATQTYAQSQNRPTFDWNEFLSKPHHNYMELYNARALSNQWVTCACGNMCDVIPRDEIGEPEDDILSELGILFHNHIHNAHRALFHDDVPACRQNVNNAKAVLREIEKRSTEILRDFDS